jgi:hypothetical protein
MFRDKVEIIKFRNTNEILKFFTLLQYVIKIDKVITKFSHIFQFIDQVRI